MKTISIINLKGGVGKTITSINIAYILAEYFGYRVLIIDNDKQGNTSSFFRVHSYDNKSIADVLTDKHIHMQDVLQDTIYENLSIIPANMHLLTADRTVLIDSTRVQQTRFKKAFEAIEQDFDFCIIDNAPDLSMSTINALVASDAVLVPLKIDNFSLDGLDQLVEQIDYAKDFNPSLHLLGCFVTMFQKNIVNKQGLAWLVAHSPYPILETVISKSVKVDESTFARKPLLEYAKGSAASVDYIKLVEEVLKSCSPKII